MPSMQAVKRWLPSSVYRFLSLVRQQWRYLAKWLQIYLSAKPSQGTICVSYGYSHIPGVNEPLRGGIVKFQRMQQLYLNSPQRFNILYLGSSSLPADWDQQLWLARRKGAYVVFNQNGVAYPGWHGPGWEQVNRPMIKLVHVSDHVFYQSQFCKLSADRFLGARHGSWEILYNAVDTRFFTPVPTEPDPSCLVLLLGGNQYQYYRLDSALQAVAALVRDRINVRLLVAGRLNWIPDQLEAGAITQRRIRELGIEGIVHFLGPYTQQQAPDIYRQAHILLHTKYNDPCSSTVIEAMACGLPVVYSCSGGTPELVGNEAGIGVPVGLSWDQEHLGDPSMLADAVLRIALERGQYAEAARWQAVERFDLQSWLQRHQEVFESLTK